MIRVTSRWWSQSSFVLTDLVSAVVNTWVFLVLPSSRMVITEGWTALLCLLIQHRLADDNVQVHYWSSQSQLIEMMYTLLYPQGCRIQWVFWWLEQWVFTEGQVLAGEFRLSSRWYTDTQTWTLPLFVTSLMCIMTLWQFLSFRALYVVHYVCAHNCLWCVWIFLQPDGRIIFCCRLDMNCIRDATTNA